MSLLSIILAEFPVDYPVINQDLPSQAVSYATQAINWFDFSNPMVLILYTTIFMDLALVAWLAWDTIRNMRGVLLVKLSGNQIKSVLLPNSAFKNQMITDNTTKAIYSVNTKPIFREGALGVNIPVYAAIEGFGATIPLFEDTRDPARIKEYLKPEVQYAGVEAAAEKELNTAHIEKDKWGFLLPLVAGAGLAVVLMQVLGWLK
jgi:hypothetical protein